MSYAIIKTGGKQYKVEKGKYYHFDRIQQDVDQEVTFDDVLFINDGTKSWFGQPVVEKAFVKGKVLSHPLGDKCTTIKFRRRKDSQTKIGSRHKHTCVEITEVTCKE